MKLPLDSLAGDRRRWLPAIVLIALIALLLAACGPLGTPTPGSPEASASAGASASLSASPSASHSATPVPTPLTPASPGADPISLMAWLFTPVFQALFILLVAFYKVTGNIAIAIVLLTLVIRAVVVPLFRQQIVSQRRMQLLQPELKEIQRRYKGDRAKAMEAQQALYKERGINPAAGCLPLILQFVLLIPMYSVIRDGLTNYDPSAMVTVFGNRLPILDCANIVNGVVDKTKPCIETVVAGVPLGQPEIWFSLPGIGFGISLLALVASLLQLVQSRMVMPPQTGDNDQTNNVQRQTALILPLISIAYGAFLPAGLFIYWIVTTIFSIIQQYLIVGFGSLFPLFGWTPAFALNHSPRFPIAEPSPQPAGKAGSSPVRSTVAKPPIDRAASAAATVRPNERRGRQGRRGRRR